MRPLIVLVLVMLVLSLCGARTAVAEATDDEPIDGSPVAEEPGGKEVLPDGLFLQVDLGAATFTKSKRDFELFQAAYALTEIRLGYRLGDLELGASVGFYPAQLRSSIGVTAFWRPQALDGILAVGGTITYYPEQWIIFRVPEISLRWRVTDGFDLTLLPISLVLVLEPARDFWVEEGFESKVPYWGLGFALGMLWDL